MENTKKNAVGEIAPKVGFQAEFFYTVQGNDDTSYHLMYKDERFPSQFSMETITFKNNDNTLGVFCDYLKATVACPQNQYTRLCMPGGQKISLIKWKTMGIPSVMMIAGQWQLQRIQQKGNRQPVQPPWRITLNGRRKKI